VVVYGIDIVYEPYGEVVYYRVAFAIARNAGINDRAVIVDSRNRVFC